MTPIQNLKSKIQNRTVALLLLLLLLSTIRLDQDRAIWRATAPGVKLVALRDRRAGPCVWLYWRGDFVHSHIAAQDVVACFQRGIQAIIAQEQTKQVGISDQILFQ